MRIYEDGKLARSTVMPVDLSSGEEWTEDFCLLFSRTTFDEQDDPVAGFVLAVVSPRGSYTASRFSSRASGEYTARAEGSLSERTVLTSKAPVVLYHQAFQRGAAQYMFSSSFTGKNTAFEERLARQVESIDRFEVCYVTFES